MSAPVIEVRNVTKTYRLGDVEIEALRGVDLTVEQRRVRRPHGRLGLGQVDADEHPRLPRSADQRRLLPRRDRHRRARRAGTRRIRSRRIGFVFQSFNLLARTSAAENVALPLFYSGRWSEGTARASDGAQPHRPPRSREQPSGPALGRPAAARGDRPRADQRPGHPAGRRADRQPRFADRERDHDHHPVAQPRARAHGGPGHPRAGHGRVRRSDRHDARRPHRLRPPQRRAPPAPRRRARPPIRMRRATPATAPAAGVRRARSREIWSFAGMARAWSPGRALARNKLRSALTMLGVFIGVAALIAMVAVGEGANAAVKAQIESLGTNLLIVVAGRHDHQWRARRFRQCLDAHRRPTRKRSARTMPRSPTSAMSAARSVSSSTATRTGAPRSRASRRATSRSATGPWSPGGP